MSQPLKAYDTPLIARLPVELIYAIFEALTLAEKKNARLVCNSWRRLLDYNPGPGRIYFSAAVNNQTILTVLRSCRQLDQVVFSGVTKRLPRMSESNNRYPIIKNATISCKNTEATLKSFLKLGTGSIESLCLSSSALQNVRPKVIGDLVQKVDWNRLNKFSISLYIPENAARHINATIALMKFSKFPSLKTFEITLFLCRPGTYLEKICLQFYSFLLAHKNSLRVLNCILHDLSTIFDPVKQFVIAPANILEELSTLNIEECFINTTNVSECFIYPCLMSGTLTKLRTFRMPRTIREQDSREPSELHNVCRANAKTLQIVDVNSEIRLSLAWLNHCTSLQTLGLHASVVEDIHEIANLRIPTLKTLQISQEKLPLQFIQRNKSTIENLTLICRRRNEEFEQIRLFHELTSLKSIDFQGLEWDSYEVIAYKYLNPSPLKHLTKLTISVRIGGILSQTFPAWLESTTPNLELLFIKMERMTILLLQGFQRLPKLKELQLSNWVAVKSVVEYCKITPGLKFANHKTTTVYERILFNHAIFQHHQQTLKDLSPDQTSPCGLN